MKPYMLSVKQSVLKKELTGIIRWPIEIEVKIKENVVLTRGSSWTETQLTMLATEVSTLTPQLVIGSTLSWVLVL